MRFGRFLVEKGQIGLDALTQALDEQMKHQSPIGKLALESGDLTMKQVMGVLSAQAEYEQSDRLFGEIAIELGFLTEAQVGSLLEAQRKTRMPIGEILVSMGAIEPASLSSLIADHATLYRSQDSDAATSATQSSPPSQ